MICKKRDFTCFSFVIRPINTKSVRCLLFNAVSRYLFCWWLFWWLTSFVLNQMEYFFIAAESHWFIFPFPKRTTAISVRCSMLNEAKIRHQIKDSSDHRGPSVTLGFLNIQYCVQERSCKSYCLQDEWNIYWKSCNYVLTIVSSFKDSFSNTQILDHYNCIPYLQSARFITEQGKGV